jgi:predicted RNase H-like HicB family nuclease
MSEHRVIFEVDENGTWLVTASDIVGCHSYGRSLSEARSNIREALDLFVETGESICLIEDQRLPRATQAAITACRRARAEATKASEDALSATVSTARFLSEEVGLGTRDIGELLGISHQRVAQLLSDEAA